MSLVNEENAVKKVIGKNFFYGKNCNKNRLICQQRSKGTELSEGEILLFNEDIPVRLTIIHRKKSRYFRNGIRRFRK